MATIKEKILRVRPGRQKAIRLTEVSDVASFRTAAFDINKELLARGVKTDNGKPPYTISKNARTGYMYIINNIIDS